MKGQPVSLTLGLSAGRLLEVLQNAKGDRQYASELLEPLAVATTPALLP